MRRFLAHALSLLTHPLLVLSYVLLLMLALDPYAFSARSLTDKPALLRLLAVFTTTFLLPALGVLLLKPLGFVRSLQLEDKQERIGPYIITGVFYLWLFKNFSGGGQVPLLYASFVLGATLGLFFAFFVNIFTKISAHATGMGGMVGMVLLLAFEWPSKSLVVPLPFADVLLSLLAVLALTVVLAGLVGAARLTLAAHTPADLYRGYAAGFVAVLLAYWML